MARFSRTAFLMSSKSYQSVTIIVYSIGIIGGNRSRCIGNGIIMEMKGGLGCYDWNLNISFIFVSLGAQTKRVDSSSLLFVSIESPSLAYISPLSLLLIMSDEQGFTNDLKTELVEVTFIPFFPPKKYKPKLYINHLKLQPEPLSIHQSVFINQQLKEQLSSKFIKSHQSNLVYNNNQMVEGRPKNSLTFEANFENGNLQYVTEQNKQYHLYIRADSNTKAHHQWYYFVVRNRNVKSISMVIHNFTKGGMLYRRGLRPYCKSLKQGATEFQQIGSNVLYQQEQTEEGEIKYCLKFNYDFSHSFDQVQFCCQPPYTSLRLSTLLVSLPFKKIQLAKTVLGHKIHALLVNEQKNSRATVVVMARQHPGESVGSWMMEGFLSQLQKLDSKIFWIIIPMVNVDGVKMGNNRTGMLGHDFNRNWNVDEESLRYHLFPELMGIIKYFKQYKKEKNKKVKMFIDLHGHSSQPNAFSYGPPLFPQSQYFLNSRLFPYMLSQANPNFNLNQCSFQISNEKKNCARSVFYNRLGFPYSYTIESSFGIYNQRNINELDMVKMGEDICATAANFVGLILSRKEERLRMLIDDVSSLSLEAFSGAQGQNSDSDYEEEPERAEFQKKVKSMLLDPELRIKEIKRFQEQKQLSKKTARYIPTYNLHEALSVRKERVKSERTKTEEVKRIEPQSQRRGGQRRNSLCLPSINGLHMLQLPRRKSREPRLSKNLSLREVTERLLTLKHNKIGRRILILNDYPTSSM